MTQSMALLTGCLGPSMIVERIVPLMSPRPSSHARKPMATGIWASAFSTHADGAPNAPLAMAAVESRTASTNP